MRVAPVAALILMGSCAGDDPGVGGPAPDVSAYGAAIRVDPTTLHVQGVVRIALSADSGASTLRLDLDRGMGVRSVRVGDRPAALRRRGDVLNISLPGPPGAYVAEVVYAGRPAQGLYARTAAGQRVVFTDSWPQRGAGWLPAVHHPSEPATLSLALELPAPWEAVASGTAGAVEPLSNGWRRWTYALDAEAPVYTFAFAAADFTARRASSSRVPVTHYLLAADTSRVRGLDRVGIALDSLSALLGPYPYETFSTVEVPLGYDGMENASAAFLRAGLYRMRPRQLEEVAFHEAVHQWIGNRVVPADWRELWLSEGFATYLTTVLYERLDGEAAARSLRAGMARLERDDATRPLRPAILGQPGDALSPTVYGKGGAVLHLLRLTVGDEAFFAGLREFAAMDRPVSTVDLRRTMERASGRDLGAFFAYWVHGGRVPVLRTHWDAGRRRARWRVEGARGVLDGLPIEVRVRQDGVERIVPLAAGGVVMPGASEPTVEPVGVVMRVED